MPTYTVEGVDLLASPVYCFTSRLVLFILVLTSWLTTEAMNLQRILAQRHGGFSKTGGVNRRFEKMLCIRGEKKLWGYPCAKLQSRCCRSLCQGDSCTRVVWLSPRPLRANCIGAACETIAVNRASSRCARRLTNVAVPPAATSQDKHDEKGGGHWEWS
jgi:hypothetical protein